jgi:hyaluronan synthase
MFIAGDNVRENIAMAKYVFTDFKSDSKFGTRLLFVNQFLTILMTHPFQLFYVVYNSTSFIVLSSTLLGILILLVFPAVLC